MFRSLLFSAGFAFTDVYVSWKTATVHGLSGVSPKKLTSQCDLYGNGSARIPMWLSTQCRPRTRRVNPWTRRKFNFEVVVDDPFTPPSICLFYIWFCTLSFQFTFNSSVRFLFEEPRTTIIRTELQNPCARGHDSTQTVADFSVFPSFGFFEQGSSNWQHRGVACRRLCICNAFCILWVMLISMYCIM